MTQTSFDLRAAGMCDPSPEQPSYPFKPTPADDVIRAAAERPINKALAEFEAER